jgi:hypothetical protein
MVSGIYELIGRIMVRIWLVRFGRQLKIAGGVLAIAAIAGGYLVAKRQPPEG